MHRDDSLPGSASGADAAVLASGYPARMGDETCKRPFALPPPRVVVDLLRDFVAGERVVESGFSTLEEFSAEDVGEASGAGVRETRCGGRVAVRGGCVCRRC